MALLSFIILKLMTASDMSTVHVRSLRFPTVNVCCVFSTTVDYFDHKEILLSIQPYFVTYRSSF